MIPNKKQLPIKCSAYRATLASFTTCFVFSQHLQCYADARSSPSSSLSYYAMIKDPIKQSIIQPRDIFDFTKEPSSQPTIYPTYTSKPSVLPSPLPTHSQYPSASPTILPSNQPSYSPSVSVIPSAIPSNVHSTKPSIQPAVAVPKTEVELPYFNYNPYDERFGPGQPSVETYIYNESGRIISSDSSMSHTNTMNYTRYSRNAWGSVRNSLEYNYWSAFDMNRTLGNRCASDPWRKQSPIDVCPDVVNAECFEHHQVRNMVRICSVSWPANICSVLITFIHWYS